MKYELTVIVGRGPAWRVQARTTNIGRIPVWLHPACVEGRLLDVSPARLESLLEHSAVTVVVQGKRYKFERLESDGSFTLQKA